MQALDDLLFELGGDVTDEDSYKQVEAWIKELAEKLQDKADNYCALITTIEKRAQVRKEEADRLRKRAGIDEKAADFLRAKLKMVMETRGVAKIETERFRISIAKNGGKMPLVIQDESSIPGTYWIEQPVLDKERLREALEQGEAVPGVLLGERGTSLRIK
jgi:hypothetical protein